MRAGRLNKRVIIEANTEAANALQETTDSWATLATVWAAIEPLRGAEFQAGQQIQADKQVRIIIWYRSDVTTEHRIAFADQKTGTTRYFEINSVIDANEKNESLELMCTETV